METDEDSEEYSPPNGYALKVTGSITPFPARVGVKVLVKDAEADPVEVPFSFVDEDTVSATGINPKRGSA